MPDEFRVKVRYLSAPAPERSAARQWGTLERRA